MDCTALKLLAERERELQLNIRNVVLKTDHIFWVIGVPYIFCILSLGLQREATLENFY